MIANMS